MNFKDNAKCHLDERYWLKQEKANCDATHTDREMKRFCHEVVKRERERRKTICN